VREITQNDSVIVRPILPNEASLWEKYLQKYHYLGYKGIAGKSLRYIATVDNEWAALLGWGSPALKCTARDRFIGWDNETKLKRLHLITNNIRFLVLPWIRVKNLASKVLALNLKRLDSDFRKVYGHPVYLAETFVDQSQFKGTCYKASNWRYVGQTSGYSKCGNKYYKNNQPKAVFVYCLSRKAKEILTADFIPYDFDFVEKEGIMENILNLPIKGLIEEIRKITDPRKARGIRHPFDTILGIAVCAVLCGARSYQAIADWAAGLTIENLRRFGSKRDKAPSEPTIRRVIQRTDVEEFDSRIGNWLIRIYLLTDKGIAMDGKTLRGSRDGEERAKHLLSALIHKEGIVIAQKEVDKKTNEIKLVKPLFEDLDIEGAVVTADALLTQREIARYLVEEKKAD